jgi:hypothetical protein
MDMRDYASSSTFIKVEHLRDGPRRERIVGVEIGQFDRPVAEFESGDKLTLNHTNCRTLIQAYGERSEDWIGKLIELQLGRLLYKGEDVDAIILQPIDPPTRDPNQPVLPKPKPSLGDQMNDEIPFN